MKIKRCNIYVLYANIFVIAFSALFSGEIKAQDYSATGYFNDGYVYKHRINPAATPNQAYFAIPALGGVYVGTSSNLSYSSFLYPELTNGGKIPTLLSPSIKWDDVEKKFRDNNPLKLGTTVNLVSVGFFNQKGNIFTTLEANMCLGGKGSIPKEFFKMLKIGQDGNLDTHAALDLSYDINNLRLNLGAHTQLAVGQSYTIAKIVKLGYKLKYYIPMASADMRLNNLNVNFKKPVASTTVTMHVKGDGSIQSSNLPLKYDAAPGERGISIDTDQFNIKNLPNIIGQSLSSFGFAADLGLVIDAYDWLQISASVTDLGVMSYKNVQNGVMKSDSGDITINPTSSDFKKEDLINDMLNFQAGDPATISRSQEMLSCTLHAGIQGRLPMYQNLSLGLLYSQQFDKALGWWEVRGSLNYDVVKIFSLSAAYAYGTYGHQLGAFASIHFTGFNFFLGVDNIPFQYTTKMIPFDSANLAIHTGLAFHFGNYFGRYGKKK